MAENIQVKITGDSTSFVNAAGRAEKAAGGLSAEVANMAKNMAGTLTVGLVTSQLVSAQREFDRLNSSLITVTGSSAAAEREMAWLKNFAKETPFGLAQATEAFVKMKALGLDPTRASLTSFGNTASAMGKDLMQFVEAVADASTGEFERLKEFGIKASKEGDKVSLTFRGVTTTIKNNAAEIQGYLQNIGNVDFAGAMEQRAKTLDGQISALGDSWNQLLLTVNSGNVGGLMADSVTLASNAVTDLTTIIGAMNAATRENTQETGAMAAAQEGLATVFETVTVLAANTSYVLTGVGREIGGIAAQAALLLQGDFSGAARVREMMIADGQKAREEVDKLSQRILGARDAAAATAPAIDGVSGSIKRMAASSSGAGAGSAALKQAQAEARDLQKLLADIETKKTADQSGLSESTVKALTSLGVQLDKGRISAEQYNAAMEALLEQEPEFKKEQEAITKHLKDRHDWLSRLAMDQYAAAENTRKSNTSLQEEIDTLGMSAKQLADYRVEKLSIAAASDTAAAAQLDAAAALLEEAKVLPDIAAQYRALAEAKRESAAATWQTAALQRELEVKSAAVKAAEDSARAWENFSRDIEQSLTDSLYRAFENGEDAGQALAKSLQNTFKTMILKVAVQAVVNVGAGAVSSLFGSSSGTGGTAGGLGGVGNLFSTGSSLYNSFSGGGMVGNLYNSFATSGLGQTLGLSTAAAAGGMAAIGGIGSGVSLAGSGLGLSAASTGAGLTLGASGGVASAGGAALTGAGSAIATAIPYVGAVLAIAGALGAFDDSDIPQSGGNQAWYLGGSSFDNQQVRDRELSGGMDDEIKSGFDTLSQGLADMLKTVGASEADVTAYWYHMLNNEGKSGTFAARLFAGNPYEQSKAEQEMLYELKGKLKSDGSNFQALMAEAYTGMAKAAIGASDLSQGTKDLTMYLLDSGMAVEALTENWESITYWAESLQHINWGATDAAAALAKLSGGLDAFQGLTSAYYGAFFSEAEQIQMAKEQLAAQFADIGVAMPDLSDATRSAADLKAEFRELVKAQDLTTASGQEAEVRLLALAGTFAQVADYVGAAADELAARAGAERAAEVQARREAQAAQLQGIADARAAWIDGATDFDTLTASLIAAGDAAGLLEASLVRAYANPDSALTGNYAEIAARMTRGVAEQLSANALGVGNIGAALAGEFSAAYWTNAYNPLIIGMSQGIADAVAGAAGSAAVAVAVRAGATAAAQAAALDLYAPAGVGLAGLRTAQVQANLAGVGGYVAGQYQLGADVVGYGQSLDALHRQYQQQIISAEQLGLAVAELNRQMPDAAALLGDTAAQAQRLYQAQQQVVAAGLDSVRYYFGSLSAMVDQFGQTAAEAGTDLSRTTQIIGQLASMSTVFLESSRAAGSQGEATWMTPLLDKSYLVGVAAQLASEAMTTASAAQAQAALAQTGTTWDGIGIRDASLLLDGVSQYNAEGFQQAFYRISDALGEGRITQDQYKTLYAVALDTFQGVETEASSLANAFTSLRDNMSDFADGLLIDQKRTTLDAGQTLAEMQRQYAVAYIGAQGGDTGAAQDFERLGNLMLDQSLYTTRAQYNDAFGKVYGDARALQRTGENAIVTELKAANADLSARIKSLEDNLTRALAQIARNTSNTANGIDRMNTVGLPA